MIPVEWALRFAEKRAIKNKPIIVVSGGMDPLHDGHVDMLAAAASIGRVIVILNSDNWLMRKKGRVFMPWDARSKVIMSIKYVYGVAPVKDEDNTVCSALRLIQPAYFANGGDRTIADPREHAVCEELGITQLFGVGGGKIRSSSDLK